MATDLFEDLFCPDCGEKSIAQMVKHICPDCWDDYVYCPKCANSFEEEE